MVDIIVRNLAKTPKDADFLNFYSFENEEWEKVSEAIKYIKDGTGKGLALCDKCDYFVSVEEAYTNGKADGTAKAIDEYNAKIKECCNIVGSCDFEDLDKIAEQLKGAKE